MSEPWELTDEEADAAAEAAFKADHLLQHYVESRGHWEDLTPTIARSAQQKLWRWLNGVCAEHNAAWTLRHNCALCIRTLDAALGKAPDAR